MNKINEIDRSQIKMLFEIETGIKRHLVEEITEAFPVSQIAHLYTRTKTFQFTLTDTGKAKKGSFKDLTTHKKDESKKVKEGGELFTGGEWIMRHKEANYYSIYAGLIEMAIVTGEAGSDAIANARLFEQSKHMYYALKRLYNAIDSCIDLTPELLQECKSVLQKATPKK